MRFVPGGSADAADRQMFAEQFAEKNANTLPLDTGGDHNVT
jgi:hypothetical protein